MQDDYVKYYIAKKIYHGGGEETLNLILARECPVKIIINGKLFTKLLASPSEFKELALGHLVVEGILSFNEIGEVKVEQNNVKIKTSGQINSKPEKPKSETNVSLGRNYPFVNSKTVFDTKSIFTGFTYLESEAYRQTRGTHLAALVDQKGKLIFQAVDVGRHNAVDKVIGKALLNDLSLSELYLLSTGRQPEYMVLKAARAGIPLVVTKSMPFNSGVEAAKKANVGLVGQLKEESILVFANEWRVRVE